MRRVVESLIAWVLILLVAAPPWALAQQGEGAKKFSNEQLDQMLAPIALYPDSLLAQVMMASTYPLQIVQADRFVRQNKGLKPEQLMEKAKNQDWDPSVKSLLTFPEVLAMMSEQLDWTTQLGDAFLSQQKDVMDSIQRLRRKAENSGNLKSSQQQQVIVEKETIIIQPANPQVVYVPVYNPTVVYGVWAYPAYPPYYYYPPGYAAGAAAFGFAVGVAVGAAASGCCWGGWNWGHSEVNINVNRYNNFTKNNYTAARAEHYSRQTNVQTQNWRHNPENRKGVPYGNQATAQKYNRASTNQAIQSRENYRGRTQAGAQNISRGGAEQYRGRQGAGQQGSFQSRGGAGQAATRDFSGQRSNALSGMDRSGSATRDFSNRGSFSRQSMSAGSAGGGFGGASRSGGFRGGGRR
jgi:hypothetical protein